MPWTCRHAPLALPAAIAAELAARYGEAHRAYHDGAHVAEVLGWFDIVADAPGAGWRAPREVFAAILFHDAVYAPGARDNEARSAELRARTPRSSASTPTASPR